MKAVEVALRRILAAALAASLPGTLLAQAPSAASAELPQSREVPAEQTAAAYVNPRWTAPKTSWGHPSLEGTYSTDDMRGIPRDRPPELGTQESLSAEQFRERATTQQTGSDRARNEETFLRNEWGTRTFGFSSLVVDPPNGRTPALTDGGARARRGRPAAVSATVRSTRSTTSRSTTAASRAA